MSPAVAPVCGRHGCTRTAESWVTEHGRRVGLCWWHAEQWATRHDGGRA